MSIALTMLMLSTAAQAASTPIGPGVLAPVREVHAARTPNQIVIDGRMTEAAWSDATPISGFLQRDPEEGAPPTERTEVLVLYDDQGLYIGARLFDQHPDSIVGRLTRRDAQASSDRFLVFIDSYHDGRTGFYFGVSAAGTLYDGTLLNDDWDDDTWDGVWQSRVERTAEGWTMEMRIPYSQLRFQRGERYVWGINFKREIARRNETDYLAYTPRNGSGFVSRFPELLGLDEVRPPRRVELLPYVTSRAEFLAHDSGDPFNDGSRFAGNAGLDAKVGLGSNLTLDATVNPDFGQVEVDPAVVNLSDVETFFPEKRPFFIEGSSIFGFGEGGSNNFWGFNFGNPSFFYSRRIGRAPQGEVPDANFAQTPAGTTILGAAKLSGRFAGGWSLGTMHALTGREMAQLDTVGHHWRTEVEPLAYYGVFRAQREFAKGRQGLGVISTLTARHFDDDALPDQLNRNALGAGLDGWTFLDRDRAWVLTGWTGVSRVGGTQARISDLQQNSLHYFQRPDAGYVSVDSSATSLFGYAARVALNRQRGAWQLNAAFGLISPGYDVNDLGFQFRADVLNYHVVGTRRWTAPGRVFRQLNLNLAAFQSQDFGGHPTWRGLWHNGNGQFLNYTQFYYFVSYNPHSYDIRLTRGGPMAINTTGWESEVGLDSDDRKAVTVGGFIHQSHYTSGADASWTVGGSVGWRPASAVALTFEPSYEHHRTNAQYIDTFDDPTATGTYGHRYLFGHLNQTTVSANLRLNWTFSPRLSLELYTQPLFSSGNYSRFEEFAKPRTYRFTEYGTGGSTITPTSDPYGQVTSYTVDPDGPAGAATPFQFDNPDFGFASLRGNAVLRWEFLPGSTMYLVWTQSRASDSPDGQFKFRSSLSNLANAQADNIFAIKFSYWWNP